jgi:hypothetical protein
MNTIYAHKRSTEKLGPIAVTVGELNGVKKVHLQELLPDAPGEAWLFDLEELWKVIDECPVHVKGADW